MIITKVTSSQTCTNCYLVEENNRVLIIDPNDFRQISIILSAENWTPACVFLTHEHFDHIEALEEIRWTWPVKVYASEECSRRIQDAKTNLSIFYDLLAFMKTERVSEIKHPPFTAQPADITFHDNCHFAFEKHSITLQRCPGHSPGSACLLLDEGYVFTGEYMIQNTLPNLHLPGGSYPDYVEHTKPWLQNLTSGIWVYPGRGAIYNYSAEMQNAIPL